VPKGQTGTVRYNTLPGHPTFGPAPLVSPPYLLQARGTNSDRGQGYHGAQL
jgi:hypothetical protein